jgi:outer membrane protein
MRKQTILIAGWLACLSFVATPAFAADTSVAFVQASRLLNESPQIKLLKQRVANEFASREERLADMQKQIVTLQTKLERDGPLMNADEQRRLRHDVTTRQLKYKHARDELAQDKQLRYSEEEERLGRVIREVIGQVAQDEKIDMVLQSGVLWYSPKVDITEKVLERLRQMAESHG